MSNRIIPISILLIVAALFLSNLPGAVYAAPPRSTEHRQDSNVAEQSTSVCYSTSAHLIPTAWGGTYVIHWPVNWPAAQPLTWPVNTDQLQHIELLGNFQGATLRITNVQGAQSPILWWRDGNNVYHDFTIADSNLKTVALPTQGLLLLTPFGGGSFDLEFCASGLDTPGPRSITTSCFSATAQVYMNDPWGGHYHIYWPAGWPVARPSSWPVSNDPMYQMELVGDYYGATYRITNRQGTQLARMWWEDANSNYQFVSLPDNQLQVVGNHIKGILFNTHVPNGGGSFDLELCFPVKLVQLAGVTMKNLTSTPGGRAYMDESRERWASLFGYTIDPPKIQVFDAGQPGSSNIFVIPEGTVIRTTITSVNIFDSGHLASARIADEFNVLFPSTTDTAYFPNKKCFARKIEGVGSMYQCIGVRRIEESRTDQDLYAVEQVITAKSFGGWSLEAAFVRSTIHPDSIFTARGPITPTADSTQACNSSSLYIELPVVGATVGGSFNVSQCETWDIDQDTDPNGFSNTWRSDSPIFETDRSVEYLYIVETPERSVGTQLGWYFAGGFELNGCGTTWGCRL